MTEALRKVQGKVDQLHAKVVHWQGVVEATRAELADLEGGVGERVSGDESGGALSEYAAARHDLSAAIEGAQAAAQVAVGKLRSAEWALRSAQAAELPSERGGGLQRAGATASGFEYRTYDTFDAESGLTVYE